MKTQHHACVSRAFGWRALRAPVLAATLLAAGILVTGAGTVHAEGITPIDINAATPEQLATAIRGVGIKRAQAIVEFRQANGPFSSVDDLTLVRGVGQKTVDASRDGLTVDGGHEVAQSN